VLFSWYSILALYAAVLKTQGYELMTTWKHITPQRTIMGTLKHGSDLLEELTQLCVRENIILGRVQAIGAVQKIAIGFYDQKGREYRFQNLEQPLEITNLLGNISIKDDKPFVHAHITLADEKGNAFGGHLASGTVVFACEFVLEVFEGPSFIRRPNDQTDLMLWES
jgi:predicted DNA-binding protein with PD1-like motif